MLEPANQRVTQQSVPNGPLGGNLPQQQPSPESVAQFQSALHTPQSHFTAPPADGPNPTLDSLGSTSDIASTLVPENNTTPGSGGYFTAPPADGPNPTRDSIGSTNDIASTLVPENNTTPGSGGYFTAPPADGPNPTRDSIGSPEEIARHFSPENDTTAIP